MMCFQVINSAGFGAEDEEEWEKTEGLKVPKQIFKDYLSKNKFYNVINKAPNKDLSKKYKYKNWTTKEKNEFRDIIEKIFPHYDNIKTNL